MTDPYQAANTAVAGSTQAPAASTSVPAAAKSTAGITDPFGRGSEYAGGGGGDWDPRIPFDSIEGRTCLMVPRSLDPAAKDPFNEGKTREEYRVDLVILDGDPFSFTHMTKASKDATEKTEQTFTVDPIPFTARLQSVAIGQIIRALKGIDAAPDKLFLAGVLLRVPQWRDERSGYTIESIAASRAAYVKQVVDTGKTEPDNRQRSTWMLVDDEKYMTAERWDVARAWWTSVSATWK